ncbi:MAG TPA: VCBS repeat-containing protein [Opitutaceae bacterium]|nr:VCBS repeat-containing protein [Opitutaceae bacterium]
MPPLRVFAVLSLVAISLAGGPGCGRSDNSPKETGISRPSVFSTEYLKPTPVGALVEGKPWIAQVSAVDLDRDGHVDILACEAQKNQIVWIRQVAAGKFEEQVLCDSAAGPVRVEPVDFDGDGDLDLLVASMGLVFPTNDRIGSVIVLENDGSQHFTKHVVADRVARVTDVRAGDFNRDGKPDLAVAQFGYDQGEIQWLENLGGWQFRGHNLLSLSGAINVLVADFNGDGTPDIAAVVAQQWEEIHLFQNDGRGNFTDKVIFGSTNEDFGSSGISLCDLNRDGRPDVLYTNGDGFDYAEPGARPWHGVQWLENLGQGFFKYHRLGDLSGAYSAVGVDLDGDGALEVVAASSFNDWKNPAAASLMVFQNDGQMNFTPHVLAHAPTHLMTLAAGELDGPGRPVLITGGFHAYGPWDRLSRISVWRTGPLKK